MFFMAFASFCLLGQYTFIVFHVFDAFVSFLDILDQNIIAGPGFDMFSDDLRHIVIIGPKKQHNCTNACS